MKRWITILACLLTGCAQPESHYDPAADSLRYTGEWHLRDVRQLTFGGNNAEAYWSFDDEQLIFQSDWDAINPQGCDQMFIIKIRDAQRGAYSLASTGKGRTTCGYFLPSGRVLYASTHASAAACPPTAGQDEGYVWSLYDTYDIYTATVDGDDVQLLIGGDGYDAEATVSPDGRYLVFTSVRSGDLELWRYEFATGGLLQLTDALGYDGGAFFSRDSQQIVWRASRPEGADAVEYQELLAKSLVRPSALNIYVANIDGSGVRQVTDLPGANWAPSFHPSGDHIIFASNFESVGQGRPVFAIYTVTIATGRITKITHSNSFDAFPMFSYDGRRIVFSSNRNVERADSRDTNVFVADWVEDPQRADTTFVSNR